jgi:putative ABC transport system permease protein
MKFLQAVKMAFSAILANKMRSFLTMLGIIIGVFAVTVLITVGQGTKDYVSSSIEGLGSNMLVAAITDKKPYELTLDDLNSLKSPGGIAEISPLLSANVTAKAGTSTYDTQVEGAAPGYDTIRSLEVAAGRFITQSDMDRRGAVAVIGTELADNLFGTRDVLGNSMTVLGRAHGEGQLDGHVQRQPRHHTLHHGAAAHEAHEDQPVLRLRGDPGEPDAGRERPHALPAAPLQG